MVRKLLKHTDNFYVTAIFSFYNFINNVKMVDAISRSI